MLGAIHGCRLLHNSMIMIIQTIREIEWQESRICHPIQHLNGETMIAKEPKKNAFEKKFGEGTAFDLDYGKLRIMGLCIYIAVQVS